MEKYKKLAWERENKEYSFSINEKKKGALLLKKAENVYIKNGKLRTGIGLKNVLDSQKETIMMPNSLPTMDSIFYVWSKTLGATGKKTLAYLSADGAFYLYDDDIGAFALQHKFSGKMKAISVIKKANVNEYYTVFVGKNGVFTYSLDTGLEQITGIEALPVGCFCGGRTFFARHGHNVVYSELYLPWTFTDSIEGAGMLSLPSIYGTMVGMETLRDKVFLFYERGIQILTVSGNARDFSVQSLAYSGGKIFADTIATFGIGGEKAVFLAEDGVYAVNENRVWRLATNIQIAPARGSQACHCAAFDGTYVAAYLDTDGEERRVAVDVQTENGYEIFNCKGVVSYGGEGFCVVNNLLQSFCTYGNLYRGNYFLAETESTNFGKRGKKTIEEIRYYGTGDCTVTVTADGKTSGQIIFMRDGYVTVKRKLRGENFSFKIQLEQKSTMEKISVTFQRLKGGEQDGN